MDTVKGIIEASCALHNRDKGNQIESQAQIDTECDGIFDFPIAQNINKISNDSCGFNEYLNDVCNINVLKKYPCIRKLFCQYNVGVPSSASVERTFSIAEDIFSKKRSRLSDQHLAACLSLKIGIK